VKAYSKLSGLRLDEIKAEHITAFVAHRQTTKIQISTLNADLAALRRIFHLCLEWGRVLIALPRVRLLPGAMSDLESARTDSFFDRGLSAPSYTRPPEFRGLTVPEVLLSGDHKKVAEWKEAEARRLSGKRDVP